MVAVIPKHLWRNRSDLGCKKNTNTKLWVKLLCFLTLALSFLSTVELLSKYWQVQCSLMGHEKESVYLWNQSLEKVIKFKKSNKILWYDDSQTVVGNRSKLYVWKSAGEGYLLDCLHVCHDLGQHHLAETSSDVKQITNAASPGEINDHL